MNSTKKNYKEKYKFIYRITKDMSRLRIKLNIRAKIVKIYYFLIYLIVNEFLILIKSSNY